MIEQIKVGDIVNIFRKKIKHRETQWDVVPCEVQIYGYDVGKKFYYLQPMLPHYEAGVVSRNSLNATINNKHSKASIRLRS